MYSYFKFCFFFSFFFFLFRSLQQTHIESKSNAETQTKRSTWKRARFCFTFQIRTTLVNRQACLVRFKLIRGCLVSGLKDVSVQSVGVLGKMDNRWHTPFNGKNLLARAIRARSTMSQRLFQGNFKTTAMVVYLD